MSRGMKRYALRGPCADCPFRADRPFHLHPARVDEIADALLEGDGFTCHKTVRYEEFVADANHPGARECGGSMATLEREGRPNQGMRIAERLGLYDPEQIDPAAPVHNSIDAWRGAKKAEA